MQRAGHDCSHGQSAASRALPEKFHRTRRKLQRNWHRSLGNVDGAIELGSFFQVAIGLTRRYRAVLSQLFDRIGALIDLQQEIARSIEALGFL